MHKLVDVISRGGNLLLNVGPTADHRYGIVGDDLFLIAMEWPAGDLLVAGIAGLDAVSLLGSDVPIQLAVTDDALQFTPSALSPAQTPCRHAFVFRLAGAARQAG